MAGRKYWQQISLFVEIPRQPGDYAIDVPGARVLFPPAPGRPGVDPIAPLAIAGRLVIDTVTETEVTGGVHAIVDQDNEVNGRFVVSVCPMP